MELPNLSRQQWLIIGGAGLVLALLWRFYASRGAAATPDPQQLSPTDPGYADLAGQLQSAGAALQNQETADVNALTGDITDLTGQVGTLVNAYGGLSDQIGGLQNRFNDLDIPAPTDLTDITERVNALAAGQIKSDRTSAAALDKAKEAAWNANPNHTVSYAQHKKHLDAGASAHQDPKGSGGSVAPSTHGKKPSVKAKPKTKAKPGSSHHSTTRAHTPKPTTHTGASSAPARPTAPRRPHEKPPKPKTKTKKARR